MQKIELLAPAGDMEKLKTAVRYGADAVYFGGEVFSLRAGAGNLTVDEMKEAMEFLHTHGAKGYLTINIYPHNEDIRPLQEYIQQIRDIPIDAFLVSDPGVMQLVKDGIPNAEIHLSTQEFLGISGSEENRCGSGNEPERNPRDAGTPSGGYRNRGFSSRGYVHLVLRPMPAEQLYGGQGCEPGSVHSSVPVEIPLDGRKKTGRIFPD